MLRCCFRLLTVCFPLLLRHVQCLRMGASHFDRDVMMLFVVLSHEVVAENYSRNDDQYRSKSPKKL